MRFSSRRKGLTASAGVKFKQRTASGLRMIEMSSEGTGSAAPSDETALSARRLPAPRRTFQSYGPVALLVLTLVATAALRIRLSPMPLERDEGEYALAGQLILKGYPPYERLYNVKWPGTYYCYALIEAVFGQSIEGIHRGLLVVNAAAIVLVFLIGRRLFDGWSAAAAALAYALLSVNPAALGFAGHATHFVVLAALAALLVLLRAMERRRIGLYFLAGVFAGLAPLMKQPGLVFTAFVVTYGITHEFRTPRMGRSRILRHAAALSAGIATPFIVLLVSLLATHTLHTFWEWTVLYGLFYCEPLTRESLPARAHYFWTTFLQIARPAMLFWMLSGLGLLALPFSARTRAAAGLLVGLLIFSFIGLLPRLVFRYHYFILVLPAVSLLFGAAAYVVRQFALRRRAGIAALATGALVVVPLAVALWKLPAFYFTMPPRQICGLLYEGNPFLECVPIGDYIRAHTRPSDSIAVLGSEPEIYFYARRLPATGHIYMYGLTERQPFARSFQEQMIAEIEAAHPKYVVLVRLNYSWLRQPGSDATISKWFPEYKARCLKTVGLVEITAGGRLRYRWNEPGMQQDDHSIIVVFQSNS